MQKIKNFIINNKNYATVIIRVSLALVLLWFGIDEIVNSENWFGYIPLWLTSNMPFSIPKSSLIAVGCLTLFGCGIICNGTIRIH